MATVNLNIANEEVMAKLRRIVSPKKAAAISAILYAEEQTTIPRQVVKLHAAIEWLVQEIVDVDPRTGLKIKAQIEKLLEEARIPVDTEGVIGAIVPQAQEEQDGRISLEARKGMTTEDQQQALEEFRRQRDAR
jgi:precorrin isomerase